jgi:hypothetical protein
MENILIIDFLKAFFNLFNAKIEEYKIIDQKIIGTVGWLNEDDKQNFVLHIDFDIANLINAKLLCDYLFENNFVVGDNLIVSESDLLLRLIKDGWNESEAKGAINFLCYFDVKMIDDGEETDSFYIHF